MPPADEAAQPVTRLTPHFHDITLENVTATGSQSAGVVLGLPESPVWNVLLHHVKIEAQAGLTMGYAEVSGNDVTMQNKDGPAIIKLAGAQVSLR